MNNLIESYLTTLRYPCLVFFIQKNSDFGKTFTLDDVETPSLELFNIILSDFATRGRKAPSYDIWVANYKESKLQSLNKSSECNLCISKYAVESFDDIGKIKQLPEFIRYVDKTLNYCFGIK